MPPKIVRSGFIGFIAGVAFGVVAGKVAALEAATFLFALSLVVAAVLKFKLSWVVTFVFLAALGSLRVGLKPESPELPPQFTASVTSDSSPTQFGAVVSLKASTGQVLSLFVPRYPELRQGNVVEVIISGQTSGGAYKGTVTVIDFEKSNSLSGHLLGLRRALVLKLAQILPEPQAAFAAGTIIGGTGGLPSEIKNDFRRSGITHILAVSGYNFTILLLAVGAWLQALSFRARMIVSFLVIPVFAILAGTTGSVLRAAVMGSIGLVALFFGRLSSAGHALLLTTAILTLFNPEIIVNDLGLQLSFLATAGLVFVMPYITHLAGKEVEDLNTFQSLLLTALAAQIATSPLILYKFGTFSLLSLPVNVLVVPVVPFIMASTAAGALLGFIIPALGQITAWPAWILASYVFKVTSTFSGLSFAQLSWQCPFILMLLSYVVLGCVIYRHSQRANNHIHPS